MLRDPDKERRENMGHERYHNIFDYYRGPSKGRDTEKTRALENNVTKALINVLELTNGNGRGKVCKRFVSWLEKTTRVKLEPCAVREFLLQKSKPGHEYLSPGRTRRILGIVPHAFVEDIYSGKARIESRTSLPDAWLLGKDWTILIESKYEGGLDRNQVRRHNKILKSKYKNPVVISWRQIHDFFNELKNESWLNARDKLLIGQFCNFLYQEQLAGFTGFEDAKYFDFFDEKKQPKTDKEEKEEIRRELRAKMDALAGDVYDCVKRVKGDAFPEYSYLKGLNYQPKTLYDSAYFYFLPEKLKYGDKVTFESESEKFMEKKAHISIQLGSEGLEVWVRLINEALGKGALHKLVTKIRSRPRDLINILNRIERKMPSECCIQLYAYTEKHFNSFLPISPEDLKLGDIAKASVKDAEVLVKGIAESIEEHRDKKDLVFALTRNFEEEEVIKLKGEELVEKIARTMEKLYPFVEFVNT